VQSGANLGMVGTFVKENPRRRSVP